ncbi:hypothetical protein KY309_00195 [Candidatus Woesearchaeota archaeon]|nr:hypothetical protein [Candidatus Woesearchaeota archaeon]MBW3016012.1 hypothetical protein [Candidatus Woesearchaeota archaeon]
MAPTDNYILSRIRNNAVYKNEAFETLCKNGADYRTPTGADGAWVNAANRNDARDWFESALVPDPANPAQPTPVHLQIVNAYRPCFQHYCRSKFGLFIAGIGAAAALGAALVFGSVDDNTRFVQDRKIEIQDENARFKRFTGHDKPGIEARLDNVAEEANDERDTFKKIVIYTGLLSMIAGGAYLALRRNP